MSFSLDTLHHSPSQPSTTSPTPHHDPSTPDGWHGTIPSSLFPPTPHRYHLYIGLFCPFAHRSNLNRHLANLTTSISLSIVKPYPKGDSDGYPGWCFPDSDEEYEGATVDHLFGAKYLHEIYFRADPGYKGRYSVPVLWDKQAGTIVSNESAEMLRWLPTAFASVDPGKIVDLYPEGLRGQIDRISEWMQRDLNAGVYKAGFAADQEGYDRNVVPVFAALNKLEKIIAKGGGPYILGQVMTELDVRAFATVVRFDAVYVQHFKCNLGSVRHDYPVVSNWLKNLYYNVGGFRESTDFRHIKENYTKSHFDINPKAITPMGPIPNIEDGVEEFSKLRPGSVRLPQVLEYEAKL